MHFNAQVAAPDVSGASARFAPYFIAPAIDDDAFFRARRTMMLEHCKWDAQVGDISTLAAFPLILKAAAWRELSAYAEALSAEVAAAEELILKRADVQERLGVPRAIRGVLSGATMLSPAAVRVIRYDFHWTAVGWRISEINSDVPGGYCEASSFTRLMAAHFPSARMAGDPAALWADALAARCDSGAVALLSAPGYLEDQQITAYMATLLRARGCSAHLANPHQLSWDLGRASVRVGNQTHAIDAIVRFYQAEWLPNLPRRSGWQHLFANGITPVGNPGSAAILESKRFPILLREFPISLPVCRRLFPPSFDPREVDWKTDARWIVKSAYSNNGDTVGIRAVLPQGNWEHLARGVSRTPEEWVAQERFEALAVDSPLGPIFPCIGVYTIDGKAAGIYGRISTKALIDYEAVDIAVLIEGEE